MSSQFEIPFLFPFAPQRIFDVAQDGRLCLRWQAPAKSEQESALILVRALIELAEDFMLNSDNAKEAKLECAWKSWIYSSYDSFPFLIRQCSFIADSDGYMLLLT